jgi:crotonobetainyl-CoA:carnitine CoA-transferase CaiB-like acyl-CoA transferase
MSVIQPMSRPTCQGNALEQASKVFYTRYTERRETAESFSYFVNAAVNYPHIVTRLGDCLQLLDNAQINKNQKRVEELRDLIASYMHDLKVKQSRDRLAKAADARKAAAHAKDKAARLATAPKVNAGDSVTINPDYYRSLISNLCYQFIGIVESVEAPDHIKARPMTKAGKADKRSRVYSYFWNGKEWR